MTCYQKVKAPCYSFRISRFLKEQNTAFSCLIKHVLSYEFPGKRKISLNHNVYEDITNEFKYKIKAFKMYKTELKNFLHPRSLKAVESIAIMRGIESGLQKAEAFNLIHHIND